MSRPSRFFCAGQGLVVPRERHALVLQQQDLVGGGQRAQVVGDQDHGRGAQQPAHAPLEDVRRHVAVHRGEGVVEQVHVGPLVHGPRQGHALLLPAAEVDPALADLRLVPGGELVQVRQQGAGLQHGAVPVGVVRGAEEHVVAQRGVLDPRHLGGVADAAADGQGAGRGPEVPDQGLQQAALPRARGPDHAGQRAHGNLQGEAPEERGAVVPGQVSAGAAHAWGEPARHSGFGGRQNRYFRELEEAREPVHRQ